MFNPMTVNVPPPMPEPISTMGGIAPIVPPPAPPAIAFEVKKPNKKTWDASIIRRAQGIYPAEAQAKAAQVQTAKMPTPTGAWGSPQ